MDEKAINKILKDIGSEYSTLNIRSMINEAITSKKVTMPSVVINKITGNGKCEFQSESQMQLFMNWFFITWNQIADLAGPLSKN